MSAERPRDGMIVLLCSAKKHTLAHIGKVLESDKVKIQYVGSPSDGPVPVERWPRPLDGEETVLRCVDCGVFCRETTLCLQQKLNALLDDPWEEDVVHVMRPVS